MPHGTDSAGGQEPQSSGPPHMGRLRGRRPRSQGRCEELRRGIRREGRALRPTWDVIARAEGQEPQRSTSQGRRPGALGARTNCATWHRFGRRPGATEPRTAPHGAVEGPEAQEPELASARCGGTDTGSAEARAIMKSKDNLKTLCGFSGDETELDLSDKGLTAGCGVLVANEIKNNGALTRLNVSDNNLANHGGDMSGVEALAAAIPECK